MGWGGVGALWGGGMKGGGQISFIATFTMIIGQSV